MPSLLAPYAGRVSGESPAVPAADSPAARLRWLRTALRLSQEQLARQLGVSFATVNRWESGRTRMSASALRRLAEFEARAAAQTQQPGALPAVQSRFIGRDRELTQLSRLLGTSRLISLIGPGGAGKTRLAIEAIARSGPAADVAFVPLEPVRQPESLVSAVASCLRVHDQPRVPLQESVTSSLAGVSRLLVLDGAEHLRHEVARLVTTLLAGADGLRIVVTSRVVLGVPGEVCWTVPPLDCPSAAAGVSDIAASDAVQLFIARAQERLPSFAGAGVAPHAIAELCRRLDGLPLAIELIAGWVGTLSVPEILQQRAVLLDQEASADQPRGRKLVDVVRASHDLLGPAERLVLPALSVFAGTFTLADAAAVGAGGAGGAGAGAGAAGAGAAGAGAGLPGAIRGLVDSSWLVVTPGGEHNRFAMLETMRSFAAARLDDSGHAPPVRRAHARHFGALGCQSEQGLAGPEAEQWAGRLDAAAADLELALQWAQETGEQDFGLDLAAALWRWWLARGRVGVGRAWLGRFLDGTDRRRDELTGRALCSAAVLAAENGDYAAAVRQAQLALGIFEQLDAAERTAFAATVLGSAQRYLGDRAAARRSFQMAADLRGVLGDRRGVSVAMNNMALLALDDGDLGRARELFEQTLVIKRQLGQQQSIAIGLANLADVLIRTSQWDAASRALSEAAELAVAVGNPQVIGTLRANQGMLAARRRKWDEAAAHYAAAIAAHQEADHPHDAVEAMIGLGRATAQLGRADEAVRQLRAAEAVAAGIGNPQRQAEVRAALADIGEAAGGVLPDGLTGRQAEVLRLLAAGLSNKQIAAELFLSPATVERHLATIYRKLGVGGRVEAARYALARGLASPPA
jgi:predicted ATPase/DNA-binding NarL/FixJ family response regulator/DNA-binding XRE family transcriptional regulator